MLRGLYSAASALVAQMTRQEMVSGNLANVDTPGFKRDSLTYKLAGQTSLPPDFASELATSKLLQTTGSNLPPYASSALGAAAGTSAPGSIGLGVFTDSPITRFDQGVLKQTDRPLDLAIVGDGFFSIRDETGKTLYTRAGDFTLDAQEHPSHDEWPRSPRRERQPDLDPWRRGLDRPRGDGLRRW